MATPRKPRSFFIRETLGGDQRTVGLVHEQSESQQVFWVANEAFKDMMQRCLDVGMSDERAFWCANECHKIFQKHATALVKDRHSFRNTKSGSASRPNKRDPVKRVVIGAMRNARNSRQQLSDFIAAMENGSVDGVQECKETNGSYYITVDTDTDEHRGCKTRKALERWWTEAGNKETRS